MFPLRHSGCDLLQLSLVRHLPRTIGIFSTPLVQESIRLCNHQRQVIVIHGLEEQRLEQSYRGSSALWYQLWRVWVHLVEISGYFDGIGDVFVGGGVVDRQERIRVSCLLAVHQGAPAWA